LRSSRTKTIISGPIEAQVSRPPQGRIPPGVKMRAAAAPNGLAAAWGPNSSGITFAPGLTSPEPQAIMSRRVSHCRRTRSSTESSRAPSGGWHSMIKAQLVDWEIGKQGYTCSEVVVMIEYAPIDP